MMGAKWIARRAGYRCDGGVMKHVVDALHGAPANIEACDAAANEPDAIARGAQVLTTSGREIVEHRDRGAVPHEPLDEMGADESSAAGDKVSHAGPLRHEPGHGTRLIFCPETSHACRVTTTMDDSRA
jgi:hypothetical protein